MTLTSLFKKRTRQDTNGPVTSIYKLKINSLQGKPITLSQFEGQFMLFVNVASKCGFTKQYKELQALHEIWGKQLVVIGLPCNQFGNQEPGTAYDIQEFCEVNYGVSFLITEKIDVKGRRQHPIYQWLTDASKNGHKSSTVRWNFQKYLVSPEGELIDLFYSNVRPLSSKITKHL